MFCIHKSNLTLSTKIWLEPKFFIDANPSLNNIDALNNLHTIEIWEVYKNNALTSLGELTALTRVNDLHIHQNDILSDYCGLMSINIDYLYDYQTNTNAYDPTLEDIINGNCTP